MCLLARVFVEAKTEELKLKQDSLSVFGHATWCTVKFWEALSSARQKSAGISLTFDYIV